MKIYLAGPINGCSDEEANGWRSIFKNAWPDTLDPMSRDYRGNEHTAFKEIVEQDKADIDASDALAVYYQKPSVGTSMEIHYAWSTNKPVILINESSGPLSPWLLYHCTRIYNSISESIEYFRGNRD